MQQAISIFVAHSGFEFVIFLPRLPEQLGLQLLAPSIFILSLSCVSQADFKLLIS